MKAKETIIPSELIEYSKKIEILNSLAPALENLVRAQNILDRNSGMFTKYDEDEIEALFAGVDAWLKNAEDELNKITNDLVSLLIRVETSNLPLYITQTRESIQRLQERSVSLKDKLLREKAAYRRDTAPGGIADPEVLFTYLDLISQEK